MMLDTSSLHGLTTSVAEALRPWAAEVAKGTDAIPHSLRAAAEEAPGRIRAATTLTVRIDSALVDAQAASLRLADVIDEGQTNRLQRSTKGARSSFEWLLQCLWEVNRIDTGA
ncbi:MULTISPECIES: hypothetical protein [unclassified Methylobacterium]|uniref:hypothetical protein n=1 Tax=unclassified Methylobacterium TaxID=2615210 RepID=UPI0011C1F21E|nr:MULTISPECIES: hypothetical protein [unclassified Methylobacterium]QEE37613.1 hypothetical protein FVA80_00225 [Methylobacterium sp. WL1]TXN52342.1 hypothetical protein FV241_29685 [Methylobacterium sp. WL2]